MPAMSYRSTETNEEINKHIAKLLGVDPRIDYAGDLNEAIKLQAKDWSNVTKLERVKLSPMGENWQASYYTDSPVHGDFHGIDKEPARAICLAWQAWRDQFDAETS